MVRIWEITLEEVIRGEALTELLICCVVWTLVALVLNVKVDASGCPVLGNFLAIKHHLEFRDARPLHATHGLRSFGYGVLRGLRISMTFCGMLHLLQAGDEYIGNSRTVGEFGPST